MDKHFATVEQEIQMYYATKMMALCENPDIRLRMAAQLQHDDNAPTDLVELHAYVWEKQPEYQAIKEEMYKALFWNDEDYYAFCELSGVYPHK